MYAKGAEKHRRMAEKVAAKKPKRTHKKKHHVTRVRNEELHEYNSGLHPAPVPTPSAAKEAEADKTHDLTRGTGGRRRTRRRRGVLARLIRNPTRRQLKALLGRR
jgi:hypothetical protein